MFCYNNNNNKLLQHNIVVLVSIILVLLQIIVKQTTIGFSTTTTTTTCYRRNYFGTSTTTTTTTRSTSLYAIGALAKKAKETELRQFVKDGGLTDSIVEKVKLMKEEPYEGDTSTNSEPGPVQQCLTKRKGTISVVAEYKRRSTNAGFIKEDGVLDGDIMSNVFREFGASAVSVLADKRMGGCTYDDIMKIKTEQLTAKGDVPGPLPIINADLIVDELQIAMSSDAGADAILLQYSLIGDQLEQFIQYATKLNLECIVGVNTVEEAKEVPTISTAKIFLCTSFEVDDKVNMMNVIRENSSSSDKNLCILANIIPRDNKSLEEVEEAWMLRDRGFHGIWASDFLYKSGTDATEHAGAIIRSLKAKSSVKYASAKALGGKGEGAREYLGDLLM